MFQLSNGTFRAEKHDIVASDDHATLLAQITAERNGKKLDQRLALVIHVSNGKITEGWEMFWDTTTWNDFWS
jgi:uncharacterized protein